VSPLYDRSHPASRHASAAAWKSASDSASCTFPSAALSRSASGPHVPASPEPHPPTDRTTAMTATHRTPPTVVVTGWCSPCGKVRPLYGDGCPVHSGGTR